MSTNELTMRDRGVGDKGFSMIEIIIVMAIMAILIGLAVPSFVQWRQSLEYRETARNLASTLREAKSRAITTNLAQQVVLDSANRRYAVQTGDRSYNATTWTPIANWTSVPSAVTCTPDTTIQFTPNGVAGFTAGTGLISIQDSDGVARFQVVVTNTGRISVTQ